MSVSDPLFLERLQAQQQALHKEGQHLRAQARQTREEVRTQIQRVRQERAQYWSAMQQGHWHIIQLVHRAGEVDTSTTLQAT